MTGLVAKPGLFRLLLAFAVVASHVSAFEVGRIAVLIFFFLSGFWVTRLWETRYAPGRLQLFYGSRWFRIWPLYIICTVAAALVAGQALRPVDFALLGVATHHNDPLFVAWSLDIELQFYLVLPLLAWLLAKPWKTSVSLMIAAVTLAGWLAFWRFGIVTIAQYLPAFALGMLACIYDWKPSQRAAYISLGAFLAFTAAAYALPATQSFLFKDVPDPFHRDIFSFLWMLPILPYVGRSLTLPSGEIDRHLGNLSYPLYLVHAPIVIGLQQALGGSPVVKLTGIAIACLVALLVYALLDRRIDAVRQRIFEPRRAKARAAQTT